MTSIARTEVIGDEAEGGLDRGADDDGDGIRVEVFIREDDLLHLDDGVAAVRLVDDFLEAVMGDDAEAIDLRHTGALAVWQTKATADGLLDQDLRVGGAEGDDGVEVRDVPALLQHVDVDDDLGRLVGVLDLEQALDRLVLLDAGAAGIDLDDLVGVATVEERIALDELQQLRGVRGVPRDDEDEGLHARLAGVAGVRLQLDLGGLVEADAVFQLHALQLGGRPCRRR